MADNNELQTNRIDGTVDDGRAFADKWPNFEAAVRNIFTFPADTVLTEAMDIDPGGDVEMTGNLTLDGAPTSDLMAATKAYLLANAGGMGVYRARAHLTSDQLLSWPGAGHYIEFDGAGINQGTLWEIANPSRMTIPVGGGGHYYVGASVSYEPSYGQSQGWVSVRVNRADVYELIYEEQSLTEPVGVAGLHLIPDLVAGDYIELYVYSRSFADVNIYSANTSLWLFNVG